MKPPVVVIGSGMGGLVVAILFAQRGHPVTVLEQHTRPGGFLHRFFRAGVGFDTGFHYVGSARRDQLLGRVLVHLGVYDAMEWIPLDPDGFDEIVVGTESIRVPADVHRWQARLTERFPHEAEGLAAFFAEHHAAVRAYGLYHLDLGTPPGAVVPWEERSLEQVLDAHIRDPLLRAFIGAHGVLYGVPAADAPFGLHALVTHHFYEGAWALRGGGDRLASALVRKLRSLGGRIVFRARATGVEVADGAAQAVLTADGVRHPAGIVFADIHPAAVAAMLPEGSLRPAYRARVDEARAGLAHFGVYLRVKGDVGALRHANLYAFGDADLGRVGGSIDPDRLPFFFLSACDGRARAGSDEDVVLGLSFTDHAAWAALRDDRAAYLARKEATLACFLRGVRARFPDWEIVWAEASTPLSTERYTGARNGAIYGHYHGVSQMGRYRFPVRTKLPNLLHVGQAVGFPGICGAAMTAYVAAGELLGLPDLVEELSAG